MRLLLLALLLLSACGPKPPPAAPTVVVDGPRRPLPPPPPEPTSADPRAEEAIALIRAMADETCACLTVVCREEVRARHAPRIEAFRDVEGSDGQRRRLLEQALRVRSCVEGGVTP